MPDRPDRLCSPCDHDGHTCAAFGCAQEASGMGLIAHSGKGEAELREAWRTSVKHGSELLYPEFLEAEIMRLRSVVAGWNSQHRGAVGLLDELADVLADVRAGVVPADGSVVRDALKRAARHANGGQT